MPAFTVLPHGTYPIGVTNAGPVNVPLGVTLVTFALDRAEWVLACEVDVRVDLSLDGGATWNSPHPDVDPFPAGFATPGGDRLDKQGVPIPQTVLRLSVPQATNANRQMRAVLTISGAPLTTTGTLTVT